MAKEPEKKPQEEESDALVEVDRVAVLEKKLKINRIIIFIFSFIAVMFITVVITGLIFLGREVYSLPRDPLADMSDKIAALDKQQEFLKTKINAHMVEIEKVTNSIAAIDFGEHKKKLEDIMGVLLRQEKDYQYLLVTLGNGVSSLANMLTGSKQWKAEYRDRIERAMEESKRREEDIRNLLSQQDSQNDG